MPNPNQTIVVVDDDPEMNQAVKRLLAVAGYHVITFPSAEAFLEAGAAVGAACLVFDVHLPGLSGFELRRRLQQEGSETPVIFMTAYDDPASQAQAEEAGATAYLAKPFPRQTFLAAIKRASEAGNLEEST